MRKFDIRVHWVTTIEAEDEGEALLEADRQFNFMGEADCEEVEDEE
jgi:hypothetical protein